MNFYYQYLPYVALLALLFPMELKALDSISYNSNNKEEEWIEGDFDLHDQEIFRKRRTIDNPFVYLQQISLEKSGEGFEPQSTVNYQNRQFLNATYSWNGYYYASPDWEFYSGIELASEHTGERTHENRLNINSLYALKRLSSKREYLGFGRQQVEDDRGWLLSEHIDGVSYVQESKQTALTGFLGTHTQSLEKLLGTDTEHHSARSRLHEYIAYSRVYRAIGDAAQGSAYIAYFSDREFAQGESNLYLGFRLLGDFSEGGSYWTEAAYLAGNSSSRQIRSFAIDTGFSYTWHEQTMEPTFTVGIAYGSGDDGLGSDSEFRQTGIHANETVFGGVVDLKYYGHVLDPQLSNLQLTTLGLGIRPRERLSIDLQFNSYWQIHPSSELNSDGIEIEPNGMDHHIGNEVDLVVGLRNWSHLSITLVYGRFWGQDGISADVGSLEFIWNL